MNKPTPIFFILCFLAALSTSKAGTPGTEPVKEYRYLQQVKQLTHDGDSGEAYFSWDDQKLIFQSNRGGYECDKIWTMNLDGSSKKMISPNKGAHTCSFYFPGNKEVVFVSTSHFEEKCPRRKKQVTKGQYVWPLYPYDIYSANIDGSNLQRITSNSKYDAEPIISHDGKKIVFGSQREKDFDIYIMNRDGSNVRRLTDRLGYDGGPWFSPDSKKIVWRAWHPNTEEEIRQWKDSMENDYIRSAPLDIWVMNSDGSQKVRLTQNGATNWSPSWHPDGLRIIFSSNMDDWKEKISKYGHNYELYLINIDGTGSNV